MKPKTKNFTLRLDEMMARKLDYIGAYYGRDRTHEIIWTLQQRIKNFEKEVGEIDLSNFEK